MKQTKPTGSKYKMNVETQTEIEEVLNKLGYTRTVAESVAWYFDWKEPNMDLIKSECGKISDFLNICLDYLFAVHTTLKELAYQSEVE